MKLRRYLWLTALYILVTFAAGPFSQTARAELFISEYIEGSSFNKAIEIYNPNSESVDLSTYELQLYSNGNSSPNMTQALSDSIAPGDVYVIANPSAVAAILAVTDAISNVINFNGDDAVALLNGGAIIDVIGQVGFDPGSEWFSGGIGTQNETLRRKTDICAGDTESSDVFLPDEQWEGFPIDAFDGLGIHNATCGGAGGSGLIISEIMYNPASAGDDWEWIEIYNTGSSTVDLTDYVLDDINSIAHTTANIAGGSIPSGGTGVLFNAEDILAADYEAAWGTGINLIPVTNWVAMGLDNAGDTISLWADFASYNGDNMTHANALVTVPYPNIDDGAGSIYLTDLAADPTNASNWALSTVGVTTTTGSVYQSTAAGGNSGADVGSPNVNATPVPTLIHVVQGTGSVTPLNGQTVTIQGVVTADYQGANQLNGFFIQEEDADQDSDPLTSEGIFVYAPGATDVAEGDEVTVTGVVEESLGKTQISTSTVTIVSSGNTLPGVTSIDLPVPATASINDYYEPFEGMRVTFSDPLHVAEYFQLYRFGEVRLTEGGRLPQFTSANAPSVAGYAAHLDELARRQIILDDDSTTQNAALPNGVLFYPKPDGFSVGTQGVDFFRGGDIVNGLSGVLDYAFSAWRVRPTDTNPVTFTVTNARPGLPGSISGRIKVASLNVLNYFTGIDNGTPICGPNTDQSCRGADSADELLRQREKIVSTLATLDADIVGLVEIENNASASLADLVNGINAVMGAGSYAYVSTGIIGIDAIKVGLLYKPASVTPAGSAAVLDTNAFVDPNNTGSPKNRPALAQTFTENINGARLTVVVNHLKSKGSSCGAGDDSVDDGQGNCNGTRTAAAEALLDWLATDPTDSSDPDFLIIGDLNAYAQEDPISALKAAGYTDLVGQYGGTGAYSFLFDGRLGYLDHALANSTLAPQITGTSVWHINADEVNIFDYNDDVRDSGEQSFEEEPDGNILYEPNAFRSSDHDPVVVGIDLAIPGPVDLNGSIKTFSGIDICAMVLASGQYMFSCNPNGIFSLTDLPREQDGTVKLQIYADGFHPYIVNLTQSGVQDITMTAAGSCPDYNLLPSPGVYPGSAGKWIDISGKVVVGEEEQTSICAMVLANGQYMFSCDGAGSYALNVPLDSNGQVKLQVYADGFAPTILYFDEFKANNDVKMARASECQ